MPPAGPPIVCELRLDVYRHTLKLALLLLVQHAERGTFTPGAPGGRVRVLPGGEPGFKLRSERELHALVPD